MSKIWKITVPEGSKRDWRGRNYWLNNLRKFPRTEEHDFSDWRALLSTSKMNEKGPTIKFQSTTYKEKMLRTVREKKRSHTKDQK